jgi:hypothetical protein
MLTVDSTNKKYTCSRSAPLSKAKAPQRPPPTQHIMQTQLLLCNKWGVCVAVQLMRVLCATRCVFYVQQDAHSLHSPTPQLLLIPVIGTGSLSEKYQCIGLGHEVS